MKKLTKSEEKQLTKEEYDKYYYWLRNKYDKSFLANLTPEQRKKIHPILLNIIKLKNKMSGFKLTVLENNIEKTNKPKIYCITHMGKYDIEVVSQVIKEHYYLFSGDFENIHDTTEGIFLGFNGVLFVKEDDKKDRALVKEKMVQKLKEGANIMYFPEGTWNLSPNLPVLQIPYGIIETAKKGNATVVPVAIEEYDKHFISIIGKNFEVDKYGEDKLTAIKELRNEMASLKWRIWESVPEIKRAELDKNSFDEYIDKKISEWPNFGLEEFYERVFKPKNIPLEKDVYAFLKELSINQNNAFLARKKDEYTKKYKL